MRADKPQYQNLAGGRTYKVGITGTGAADPTKRHGPGITVTRTAAGVYKFSFASHPGTLLGFKPSFGADTPSAVKGYTATRDTYTAPSGSTDGYVEVSVWDSTFTAADLAALQYLDLEFEFTEVKSDLHV